MASVELIDKYTIRCNKKVWSENDEFLAACLNIKKEEDYHLIDVRIVSNKATFYYLNEVFPYIMKSPESKSFRAILFNQLKKAYSDVYDDFIRKYYPKAGYTKTVGRDLYQHQKETIASSIYRRFNLLALDMGTGKTLTAATISKITGARRTVIICPSLVKWNWFHDMTDEWGYNPMYWTILDSKKQKCIYAFRERFVVLNFEQVRKQMKYLLRDEINHIIIDEAHYLKNHQSGRSKAVDELIKGAGEPRVTMLTGTPVTNRINDMFNYLKMSGHPLGDNFVEFKKRYTISAKVNGERIIGAQNIHELKGRIANLMIRLRSEDCLDLPDMIIKKYYFEAGEVSEAYGAELDELRKKKEKYDQLHGVEKAKMNTKIKANIHTLNRLIATAKVHQIKELVDNITADGEKVVVFAGYKAPLQMLQDLFGDSAVKIDGSVDPYTRQQLINRFKKDPTCKVFLGNMRAAGIGINLVNARHVIFMNFPFTPDEIEQAQKRLHRSGQKKKVNVYYTIAKETIDEHIYSLIADKAHDINLLIDGDHQGVINYNNISQELFKKLIA